MNLLARQRAVFEQVVELAPATRDAALAALCEGDSGLYGAVRELLEAAEVASGILDRPATMAGVEELLGDMAAMHAMPVVGQRLGQFVLLKLLGEGGMGTVYLAEQDSPKRRVALKLLRSPVVTGATLARFEREAAALARLRHPGIAQIFEAGTLDGGQGRELPYYAMEYVPGAELTAYAGKLGEREKLELFVKVCDAVQHAHQKGVIHRDLKPANIVVDVDGGVEGSVQPKVLDFGIAMLTDSDEGVTSAGQVIGTLPYMSPEQVRGDHLVIDTRSDVYGLGVILYEMLTGRVPVDVKGLTVAAAAVKIEQCEPAAMVGVSSDVQTIVLKALEKSGERRYQSAMEFAEDVRRFLSDMPIVARPATAMYTLRKFAKRHRGLMLASGLVVAGVVVGAVGLSVGIVQAKRSQQDAELMASKAKLSAQEAEMAAGFLSSMLSGVKPVKAEGHELTVREVLDDAVMRVDELRSSPSAELRTRQSLAGAYVAASECEQALAQAQAACELAAKSFGEESLENARALATLGAVTHECDRPGAAVEIKLRVLAIREKLLRADDVDVALAQYALAKSLHDAGRLREAMEFASKARPILMESGSATAVACTTLLAEVTSSLDEVSGREQAVAMLQQMLAQVRERGARPADVAALQLSLGRVYSHDEMTKEAEGPTREALELMARMYVPDHAAVLGVRKELARILRLEGKFGEAKEQSQAVVDSVRRVYGQNTKKLIEPLNELGKTLDAMGEQLQSAEAFAESAELCEVFGGLPSQVAQLSRAGEKFEDAGEYERSEQYTLRAIKKLGDGATHEDVGLALRGRMARLLFRRERERGMAAMEEVMRAYEAAKIEDANALATWLVYADGLAASGELEAAIVMWERCEALAKARGREAEEAIASEKLHAAREMMKKK